MEFERPGTPCTFPSGGFLCAPGEREVRWMGETCTRFLATGENTNDQFCLVDETARRGEAVPLHRHPGDPESFYVLSGEIAFYIDGCPAVRAGPHSFLHVPGGAIHGFRVVSDTARYLILTTPHHGEFYRAISIPAEKTGRPDSFEVDWDNVMAMVREFGIEFMGDLPEE